MYLLLTRRMYKEGNRWLSVTSTDVDDTVEGLMPQLMEIFASGGER